ncbi:MAG: hypothetical protein FWF41_07945, partial [Betaproteobacteria bacterium]|nr:hypothetical protein [Betaproteobacteria bacterium]
MVRAFLFAFLFFCTAALSLSASVAFASDVMRVEGTPVLSDSSALSAKANKAVFWHSSPNSSNTTSAIFLPLSKSALTKLQEENSPDFENHLLAKAIKIGTTRYADTELSKAMPLSLNWQRVSDGSVAWLEITSPEAHSLRAALQILALPDSAELRFSGSDAPDRIIGVITGKEVNALRDDDKIYWTPITEGEIQHIEIFLPLSVSEADANVHLNAISHLFTSAKEGFNTTALVKASASCEVDVACKFASLGTAFQNTSKAVARMVYSLPDGSYTCTGTLLNDSINSQTPYFWSAAHCISTQTAANTLNTYWFYEYASCGGSALNSNYSLLSGGAQLLHAGVATDTLLLRLNNPAPAGAYFAAWDASSFSSGAMIGIHHPKSDVKKISTGKGEGRACDTFFSPSAGLNFAYFPLVSWSEGTVEPGSSGSGLFTLSGGNYYLRGGLYGGNAACAYTGQPYNTLGPSYLHPDGSTFRDGNASCYSSLYVVYDQVKQYLSPSSYTITASVSGTGGSISPSGSVTGVASGTTRTFTVTPNTGYTASVGGTCGGTLSGNTYTTNAITANCTVVATFTPTPYTVTASVSGTGGSISPLGSSSVNYGSTKAFTVTANTGYTASIGGTCGGSPASGSGTFTFTTNAVTANCTVTASFAPITTTYTITASAGTGGTISPSGSVTGVTSGT